MSQPAALAAAAARRRALWALLMATGVGGLSWLGLRSLAPSGGDGAAAEPEQALWQQRFQSPQGAEWAMQSFHGQRVVVNFWATWCPPCVEELPMLNAFYQTQRAKGWTVLGLAVDKEAAVSTFLQRMPLTFPIAIAGMQGAALSKELGNSAGGLPFTVLFDRHGAVQHRKMGQLHASDLQNWASL